MITTVYFLIKIRNALKKRVVNRIVYALHFNISIRLNDL